jgi:hypothetical protein
LSPVSESAALSLTLMLVSETPDEVQLPKPCEEWMRDNPSAASLPLLAMLARGAGECVLSISERGGLRAQMEVAA